jgi:hypothetical protein
MGTRNENPTKEKMTTSVYESCDLDAKNDQAKFVVDGKKDEDVEVTTTNISWEIMFHLNGINCHNQV